MNVLISQNNAFLSKRKRIITFGTVEMTIAFSVMLQCMSGEKSKRKVSMYESSNSVIVIGKLTLNNKYWILKLIWILAKSIF